MRPSSEFLFLYHRNSFLIFQPKDKSRSKQWIFLYLMILMKMLRNWLCLLGKHHFPCLKRPILMPWTSILINKTPRQQETKEKSISRSRMRSRSIIRKDTASILYRFLFLCGRDISSLPITKGLVQLFLGATAIFTFTWFQWLGTITFLMLLFANILFWIKVVGWFWFHSSDKFLSHSPTPLGLGQVALGLVWDLLFLSPVYPLPTPTSSPARVFYNDR